MLSIGTTTTVVIDLLQTVFKTLLEIIVLTGAPGRDPDPAIGNIVVVGIALSLVRVEGVDVDGVDAADVDCGHGPVGGHGPLGGQLLQTGQGPLSREWMGVAAEKVINTVINKS